MCMLYGSIVVSRLISYIDWSSPAAARYYSLIMHNGIVLVPVILHDYDSSKTLVVYGLHDSRENYLCSKNS